MCLHCQDVDDQDRSSSVRDPEPDPPVIQTIIEHSRLKDPDCKEHSSSTARPEAGPCSQRRFAGVLPGDGVPPAGADPWVFHEFDPGGGYHHPLHEGFKTPPLTEDLKPTKDMVEDFMTKSLEGEDLHQRSRALFPSPA